MHSIVEHGIMPREVASRVPISVAGTGRSKTLGKRYAGKSALSDLYVYQSGDVMVCHECILKDGVSSPMFNERGKMISHLIEHQLKQHLNASNLIVTLIEEIRVKGEKIS